MYKNIKMLNEFEGITKWQVAKKIYHMNGFNLDFTEFGLSK